MNRLTTRIASLALLLACGGASGATRVDLDADWSIHTDPVASGKQRN
ncbi:MAG: hypothetical protein ABI821_13435 [Pseudomonadota bacterium]